MKLIIDIPESAYEAYKEWNKSGVATVEQTIIAHGTPFQERPQTIGCFNCKYCNKEFADCPCCECNEHYSKWETEGGETNEDSN